MSDWQQKAISDKQTNKEFLSSLPKKDKEYTYKLLLQHHLDVFSETDCLSCANCCKTTPAIVTNNDISRMAKHLSLSPKQIKRQFLIEDVNGEFLFAKVPCVFLEDDNKCKIYEARPEACRRYPHTDEKDYIYRNTLNIANTIVCPAAFNILERLKQNLG
jgi:Fe-S-cluster containining protein